MLLDAVLFVSKRLQPVCAALVCLAFAQLAIAACTPQATPPGAVRVAISR
jgi:hypothetical protein